MPQLTRGVKEDPGRGLSRQVSWARGWQAVVLENDRGAGILGSGKNMYLETCRCRQLEMSGNDGPQSGKGGGNEKELEG